MAAAAHRFAAGVEDQRGDIGEAVGGHGLGQAAVEAFDGEDGGNLADEAARIGFTGPGFPFDPESPLGNQLMKVLPMNTFLCDNGVAALATAIRWDEHPAREGELYESPREEPPHLRVHPILHMREADVWAVTRGYGLAHCSLYAKGYRSLGTLHGTVRKSDLPAWEQDLDDRSGERAGRDQDKEDAMEQLRALGYM